MIWKWKEIAVLNMAESLSKGGITEKTRVFNID